MEHVMQRKWRPVSGFTMAWFDGDVQCSRYATDSARHAVTPKFSTDAIKAVELWGKILSEQKQLGCSDFTISGRGNDVCIWTIQRGTGTVEVDAKTFPMAVALLAKQLYTSQQVAKKTGHKKAESYVYARSAYRVAFSVR